MSSGIGALGETGAIGTNADGSTFAKQNKFGQSGWFKATMIASAGLSGGLSSSIAGGSFWAGARQGVIVATMNHLGHMGFDDNGYDKFGNRINDNGGDTTDYKYDDNGNIIETKKVLILDGGSDDVTANYDTFGIRLKTEGTGVVLSFNNLARTVVFGKVSSMFYRATGGLKQWLRVGPSFSKSLGSPIAKSIRWGASPKHAAKIESDYLRMINQKIRNYKAPGDTWRVNDGGHFHLKK